MGAVRALQRRVAKLERGKKPRPSPFVLIWGTFDNFVEEVLTEIEGGKLCGADMIVIVAALRRWEEDGTWTRATAS